MKNFFRLLRKDNALLWSFWITIILLILMTVAIVLTYTSLPPFIPLYNHMPWGYARLGKTYELFFLPLSIALICLINSLVGMRLIHSNPLLTRFLFVTVAILALFTSIFIGRLIFLTL